MAVPMGDRRGTPRYIINKLNILISIGSYLMGFDYRRLAIPVQAAWEEGVGGDLTNQVLLQQESHPKAVRFIRPINLAWFLQARALSPMAAVMACCLWYRYGLERTPTIKATRHKLEAFGIGKTSSRRILRQMEVAHLISVAWHPTRAPEVTLLIEDKSRSSLDYKQVTS